MQLRSPRLVLQDAIVSIFAFPPNRETLGGTAYLIVEKDTQNRINILVDCPIWDESVQSFLAEQGGVQWLVLTHRGAIASLTKIRAMQTALNCQVVIQEQEAYLLPGLSVVTFGDRLELSPRHRLLWTPGHSPGSACLYTCHLDGVLFSGRHLLPTPTGEIAPIKTAKTFHWRRQLGSVQRLQQEFTPETLRYLCPGANLGFLRGQYAVQDAAAKVATINTAWPS
jgi:glyoxylase-like metal-dependent hydrolase (beta-lactamase superfamily II)